MRTAVVTLLVLLVLLAAPLARAGEVRVGAEALDVRFDPGAHEIHGTATLRLAEPTAGTVQFRLARTLQIVSVRAGDGQTDRTVDAKAVPTPGPAGGWPATYEVATGPGDREIRVEYRGEIYDAVRKAQDLAFVVGDHTHGVISPDGIFLTAGSLWYPVTPDLTAFPRVRVSVPEGLVAVTQGALFDRKKADGREVSTWGSEVPVDGLALQAGPFVVTTRKVDGVAISTYLYPEDQENAGFLLDEIQGYLSFYRPILGAYPWPKFDVVENFFATGYGMPTYTLLGRAVVKEMVRMAARYGGHLPPGFVDHELVHCWWGNYVYPDYDSGNWCEGLTTYCSNYLRKEAESETEAIAHRKKICTTFSIQVNPANDYPVRKFAGKTEDFENDIGYGKCAMLFHMLRRRVGSDAFFATLRGIIRDYGGKHAAWADFEKAFSKTAGSDLSWFFDQWLDRTGGPVLSAGDYTVVLRSDGLYEVRGEIRQEGTPWRLDVPVTVEHPGGVSYRSVPISKGSATYSILTPRPPLSVEVDANFDVFRVLPADQIQPCLNLTLSRPDKVYVVPEGDAAYRGLAEMAKARKGGEIVAPGEGLPGTDCLLLGRPDENPAVKTALGAVGITIEGKTVTIRGEQHDAPDGWLLVSFPHPTAKGKFVTVFAGLSPAALARARVIFFYGWDGYLVYSGHRPVVRGDFTEIRPQTDRAFPLPVDAAAVAADLAALTDPALAGRRAGTEGGAKTRELLTRRLAAIGALGIEPFTFTVRDLAEPDVWARAGDHPADEPPRYEPAPAGTVVPALFSAPAPDGIHITRITRNPREAGPGSLLMLPDPGTAEALGLLLANVADTTASAIGIPMSAAASKDYALAGLAAYPSRTKPAGEEDPWMTASGRQSRAMSPPVDLPCPVVFVDTERVVPGETDALLRIRFTDRKIESANLTATIPAPHAVLGAKPVLLTAHFDSLGRGFAGADDNASGVAAVLAAAGALRARSDLLRHPVLVVLFGGEEWGLRGSTAFAARHPAGGPVVNLDTVGARDAKDVYLIGRSRFPELSARAAACLSAEGFGIGRDIDRFAFAWGSDHWPFAARGQPALDLYSGQYHRMNSTSDTLDLVDPDKTARMGRAAARLVLDLAAEDLR